MYGTYAGRRHSSVRTGLITGGMGAMVLLSACSSSGDDAQPGGNNQSDEQPVQAGAPFWVNPSGNAAQALAKLRETNKRDEAVLIAKIASQPVGEWIGTDDPEGETRRIVDAAVKQDTSALLVMYNIPHRDCGQYSQGGAADGEAYRDWVDKVVKGIGDRGATVIVEPDALPHMLQDGCVPDDVQDEQYTLIKEAVDKLKELPGTKVYLDAGNPAWIRDPGGLVEPLRKVGIDRADGFSLNVSNFQTTKSNIEYGKRLSSMVGDKHFVVDTGRNGNGPAKENGGDAEAWCNPPGRALGEAPTTDTGEELVDAFMWIKRPGESDGTCKGGPKAGQWFQAHAIELARNAEE